MTTEMALVLMTIINLAFVALLVLTAEDEDDPWCSA